MHRTLKHALSVIASGVLIAGMAAGPAFAGPSDVDPKIVGGGVVDEEKPWIAALHHNGGFRCTASQIAPEWVLTAAHCVTEDSGFMVRIGSLQRSSGGTVVDVSQVVRHPSYEWPRSDIALLKLAQPHDNTFVPVAEASDIQQGQAVTLYGWGSENPDWSGPLPENLKYADGSVSETACQDDVAPLICTQTDGSVAGGDSGGPAIITNPNGEPRIGGDCAVGHKPAGSGWAAYTSTAVHRDWIREVAGT